MFLDFDSGTVDMLDIYCDLNTFEFDKYIKPFLKTLEYKIELKYWESFKWNSFRYNWSWKSEFESFFFAYSLNLNDDLKTRFKLSFNPNKCDVSKFPLSYLINIFKFQGFVVQSADIAFDYLGVTTSDIIFDKKRKKEYKIFKYPNSDLTFYLGSGNGRIKIYDKAREEKLPDCVNKTRIEFTIDINLHYKYIEEYNCNVEIPEFVLKSDYILQEVGQVDKILIRSVTEGIADWEEIPIKRRRKLQEILEKQQITYTKIKPSQSDIEKVIKEYMKKF